MNKYEEELYNFLTLRENFEAMLKVNSQFSIVKERLLADFWNHVATILESKVKELSPKWRVLNPPNKERGDAKLIVYKDDWIINGKHPFVGVAWEHLHTQPYFGVWADIHSPKIDDALLDKNLENLRLENKFRRDTSWWPLWEYSGDKFSTDSGLSNILPDNMANTVETYTLPIMSLLPKVENFIDESIK